MDYQQVYMLSKMLAAAARLAPACCTYTTDSISTCTKQSTCGCRAAMALLRQEARFVDHLFASGMVDEAEHEQLLKPIEKRERRMQRQGALWRVPLISEVGTQVEAKASLLA